MKPMMKPMMKVVGCLFASLWLASCAGDQAGGPDQRQARASSTAATANIQGALADDTAVTDPADALINAPADAPAVRPEPLPDNNSSPRLAKTEPPRVVGKPDPSLREAPRPTPELQQLLGLDRAGLSDLLGKPTLLRREASAEVWQYGTAQCVLHLFLYRDSAEGSFQVVHIDAVSRGPSGILRTTGMLTLSSRKLFQQQCFGHLLRRAVVLNKTS